MTGLFVVIEGIDGCGKDTQIELLRPWLVSRAQEPGVGKPFFSHEPGAGLGPALRRLLLERDEPLDPLAETLLFVADRAQHVAQLVRPLLEAGSLVVLNRHAASTLAYQGYGKGVPLAEVERLNRLATGGLQPQRVYLLDLPAEEGLARVQERTGGPVDAIERGGVEFLRRVRAGYLEEARREPGRWAVLDATRAPGAIQEELRLDLARLLERMK